MQTFSEWLEQRDPEFYLEAKGGFWGTLGAAGLGAAAMKGVMGAASLFAPTDTSQLPQVPAGYESQPAVVQQADQDQEYQSSKRAWAPHRQRMQQNRSDLERKADVMKQHGVKKAQFIGGRIVDPEKGPDAEQQQIIKMGRELGVR